MAESSCGWCSTGHHSQCNHRCRCESEGHTRPTLISTLPPEPQPNQPEEE